MISKIYKIGNGFTGIEVSSKSTIAFLGLAYLFVLYLIGRMYSFTWYENYTPAIIKMNGREIGITEFSSVFLFLFIIIILINITWLSMQAKSFYNRTTMDILWTGNIPARHVYFYFFIKRIIDLIIIDSLFIVSLLGYFYLAHGAFPYLLAVYSFLFFSASCCLIILYDFIQYVIKKASSVGFILAVLILVLSLLRESISQQFETYFLNIDLTNLIPDIIFFIHQYILISFGGIIDPFNVIIPLIVFAVGTGILFKINTDLYLRYTNDF